MSNTSLAPTQAYIGMNATQQDPKALSKDGAEAAQAFEAMFVNEVFKIMRRTMPSTQSDFGQQMFTEMFDEQMSRHIAEAGLGMQNVLWGELGEKTTQDTMQGVDTQFNPQTFDDSSGQDRNKP